MIKYSLKKTALILLIAILSAKPSFSEEAIKPIKVDWSFKGIT